MAAPVVSSTTPTTGVTDFDVESSLTATFTAALLESSVGRGTVILYETASGRPVDGDVSLSADGLTITFSPRAVLRETTNYRFSLVGTDIGAPVGAVKDSSGDSLATTYTVLFRTARDAYVDLTEATVPGAVERTGPIREVDADDSAPGYITPVSYDPPAFSSGVMRATLDNIEVDFGEAVYATGTGPAMTVSMSPADGYVRDYAQEDVTGKFLYREVQDVPSRLALFVDPTGNVSFSGNTVIWTPISGYEWTYNAEILVQLHADRIANASGEMLEDDLYFTFTTEFWPVYGNPTVLRLELGPAISSMYDDTLYRILFKNSIRANLEANYNFDIDDPYGAVERFVKAQSVIDVITELRLLADIQAGQRKTLGDFTVQYNASNPFLIAKLKEAEEERDRALRELRHYRGKRSPKHVVQSENWGPRNWMRSWDQLMAAGKPTANMAEDRATDSSRAGVRVIIGDNDEMLIEGDSLTRVLKWTL